MIAFATTIGLFLLIIGTVIFVHELGHFVAARLAGMVVEEFSLGMGPKIWSFTRKKTEYMVKALPIGGYVKILGEEEEVKKKGSFSEKSVWARMFVALAGVFMNFVFASVLFYGVLLTRDFEYEGIPYYEGFHVVCGTQEVIYAYPVTVVGIVDDTPAQEAGLEAPFEVYAVDGVSVDNYSDMHRGIESKKGGVVSLAIGYEDGSRETVSVEVGGDGIGVEVAADMKILKISYTGWERVFGGFLHSVNMIKANIFLFGALIGESFRERSVTPVAQSIAGPIGLVAIVDVVKQFGGLIGILDLAGLFCIALVMMNMLPFPALDGGHAAFLAIEAVRGRPVDRKLQQWLFGIGMVVLFALMFLVSVKDVFQFGLWDWVRGPFSR